MSTCPRGNPLRNIEFKGFDVIDEERALPANFQTKVHAFYKCIPELLLPQRPSVGKLSYTITDSKNRACEVQCDSQCFYVKRGWFASEGETGPSAKSFGNRGNCKSVTPTISCRQNLTIEAAWEKAKQKMGGWEL